MDNSELLQHSKTWDRTGVAVAALCMLHCLALPLLLSLIPAADFLFDSVVLEALILCLGVGVGSISFYTSFKKHRKIYPTLLGLFGVSLLLYHLFEASLPSVSHQVMNHADGNMQSHWDMFKINPYMALGGLFLILGHLWNIHACHCFCDKSCDHQEHKH